MLQSPGPGGTRSRRRRARRTRRSRGGTGAGGGPRSNEVSAAAVSTLSALRQRSALAAGPGSTLCRHAPRRSAHQLPPSACRPVAVQPALRNMDLARLEWHQHTLALTRGPQSDQSMAVSEHACSTVPGRFTVWGQRFPPRPARGPGGLRSLSRPSVRGELQAVHCAPVEPALDGRAVLGGAQDERGRIVCHQTARPRLDRLVGVVGVHRPGALGGVASTFPAVSRAARRRLGSLPDPGKVRGESHRSTARRRRGGTPACRRRTSRK